MEILEIFVISMSTYTAEYSCSNGISVEITAACRSLNATVGLMVYCDVHMSFCYFACTWDEDSLI
jgi:hypothetical protein